MTSNDLQAPEVKTWLTNNQKRASLGSCMTSGFFNPLFKNNLVSNPTWWKVQIYINCRALSLSRFTRYAWRSHKVGFIKLNRLVPGYICLLRTGLVHCLANADGIKYFCNNSVCESISAWLPTIKWTRVKYWLIGKSLKHNKMISCQLLTYWDVA